MPSFRLMSILASFTLVAAPARSPRCRFPSRRPSTRAPTSSSTTRAAACSPSRRPTCRVEPASITKLMTGYVVFRALREKRLSLTDSVTISEHAWKAEGLAHLRAGGHADPGGRAHQGHDRAVGQRRHHRAGREARRHRRRLRADDELVRGRARPQELALRQQLGRPGPDALHERARHRDCCRAP